MLRNSFEDRLIGFYPALFPVRGLPNVDAQRTRILCGDGWFPLIEMLCDEVQELIDSRGLPQVTIIGFSEKFGGMRVSYQGDSEPVRKLVEAAERASFGFCEVCGIAGTTQRTAHGWIKTLCVGCAAGASAN